MASTVDTGDVKLRLYETRQLTALDPGHKILFDDPIAGPGHAGPEAALAAGMLNTPQTVAMPSAAAEVILLDQGRVQRYPLGNASGGENQWYLGPFATAPLTTSVGLPVLPGHTYFDTSTAQMYVYTGAVNGWQVQAQMLPANLKTYTWYCTLPQQSFPDRSVNPRDVHGQILSFEVSSPEDVTVFLNGSKLIGNVDFFLRANTTVDLAEPACADSIVEIRVAKRVEINYAVSAAVIDTARWVLDGVTTTFPLYDMQGRRVTAATSVNCIVSINGFLLNPATEFQVLDGNVVFTISSDPLNPGSGSPEPDDTVWMQVGLPITPTIWDNAIEIGGGGILEISPGEPLLFQGTAPVLVVDDTTPTQLPAGLVPLTQAPTPSAAVHGKFCLLSRSGFTDQLLICIKGQANDYYWQPVIYDAP